MGKIVKYCSSCDEGFAERFTFCPDCGSSLQSYEMNPVTDTLTPEVAEVPAPPVAEPAPTTPSFITETPAEAEPAAAEFEDASFTETPIDDDVDMEYDDSSDDYVDVNEYQEPVQVHAANSFIVPDVDDDDYHVTVIEETNGAQRNGLLFAASIFMIVLVGSATVYSLFIKPLDIGAIGDGTELAYLLEEVPMDTDEDKPKPDKDKAGGGGGGGKQEKDHASRGDLADQVPKPTRPPDVNTMKSDDPMLQTPTTQGNLKLPKVYNKWGLPNGLDGLSSNGSGTGGGIGSGTGSGQGSGTGTGAGSGTGSGYGNGRGNGNGDGTGDGTGGEPPSKVAAVTTPLKIIAKPRAQYTDEARQNQVQGTVVLKVTLMANGSIGSIVPVTRLGYGLTEKAIAAARQIQFEPKKVNGIAQSVTKTIEYNFNIY